MAYIDPWRGTNEGLATLRGTFDDIDKSRIRKEEMDRQARQDALNEPYLRTRNELSGMELGEKQRTIANLQEYDAARKDLEGRLSTGTVPTELLNPDYKAATPQGLNSTMTYAGEANEAIPAQPAQGLPTVSGQRPMNEDEKLSSRALLAIKHGRLDDVMKMAKFTEITDKMDSRSIDKITKVMTLIEKMSAVISPEAALVEGKRLALQEGMEPKLVEKMVLSPQGFVASPDGQGGTIVTLKSPDGKYHVVHSAGKEDKSQTEEQLTARALKGDKEAQAILDAMKARRLDIARAGKADTSGKLSFADKEALRAMGKSLPKSKVAAETAVKNLQKIDRMIALVDKGAGGVRGELFAKINKVADVLRVTPPEDAKYNTLTAELRGFAGTLRLQLGLIGQTSDRDVAIMYEAAGGNSPAESQKAILQGYRQGYQQDVDNYNSDAKAYSEAPDSKVSGKLYRQITVTTPTVIAVPPDLPKGTKNNGDGTFTLPNGKKVRPE